MSKSLIELLDSARALLEGHTHSAYCQSCNDEEYDLVKEIEAHPEMVSYLEERANTQELDRAKMDGRWCEECQRTFDSKQSLKMHRRDKHD